MVTDERGQRQETKVWRLTEGSGGNGSGKGVVVNWERVAGRLWAFGTGFAKSADVEWRMVVCKMGLMGWGEIGGEWDSFLFEGRWGEEERRGETRRAQIDPLSPSFFLSSSFPPNRG